MDKIAHYFGLSEGPLERTNALYVGLECEIEDVVGKPCVAFFDTTSDGSLRNNGLEFISHPLDIKEAVTAFKGLHSCLEFAGNGDPFSSRTSTHVHVNCLNLDLDHVKNILLYYALYEEYFFLMVSPDRKNNIHCVPLNISILPKLYKRSIPSLVERWSKYTALNLLPLTSLGTMEFRHLQGTGDAVLLENWLTVIERLFTRAKDVPITHSLLEKTDWILDTWKYIFGHVPALVAMEPTVTELTKNTLLDVKLAFVKD